MSVSPPFMALALFKAVNSPVVGSPVGSLQPAGQMLVVGIGVVVV